jgi:nucleoid-associated protein YgaU
MLRRIGLLLAASLALAGCNLLTKKDAQFDDARNPYYKQAQQDLDNNNAGAAAADYEEALAADSKLAGAHYELGKIDADKLNDPIGAIYHFKKFLELAPNSEHADDAKAEIDKESTAFVASLPNSPQQNADDFARLQGDNATLKKQLDDATATIAQLQAKLAKAGKHHSALAAGPTPRAMPEPPPAPAPVPAAPVVADTGTPTAGPSGPVTPKALPVDPAVAAAGDADHQPDVPAATAATTSSTNAAEPAAPPRSYTVVKGDSYWKIAKKMYPGDTKNGVTKIEDANKQTVGKPLKIGQVLVIP